MFKGYEWTFGPLLILAGTAIGVAGSLLLGVLKNRTDKTAKFWDGLMKEVERLGKIVPELEKEVSQLNDKLLEKNVRINDLVIALNRVISRLKECVEVVNLLLRAKKRLEQGDVKKAEVLLVLIERDMKAMELMNLTLDGLWGDRRAGK